MKTTVSSKGQIVLPKVIEWLSTNEADLVVDSIILGELCIGIEALPAGRKRARLARWFVSSRNL